MTKKSEKRRRRAVGKRGRETRRKRRRRDLAVGRRGREIRRRRREHPVPSERNRESTRRYAATKVLLKGLGRTIEFRYVYVYIFSI